MKYECQPLYRDGPYPNLQEVTDLGTECIVSKFISWREAGILAWEIFFFSKRAQGEFLFPTFQFCSRSCGGVRRTCVLGDVGAPIDGGLLLGLAVNVNSPFRLETRGCEVKFRTTKCIFSAQVEGCCAPGLKAIDYILSQGPS